MRRFLILLFAVALLSGCATRVDTGSSTAWTLDLRISHGDGEKFYLYDSNKSLVSSANATNGLLSFKLPDRYIESCVSVFDSKGKNIVADNRTIYMGVRLDLEKASRQKQQAESESQQFDRELSRKATDASNAERRLAQNSALRGNTCVRPEISTPPRPRLRCNSDRECRQDGAAICYTRFLGAMGCETALEKLKIPGLLSSPSCAATAARLAGEKYDMGEAFKDALLGAASDTARQLRKSDSFLDNLLGAIGGVTIFAVQIVEAENCTNSFVDRELAPLTNWNNRFDQLKAASERKLLECNSDLQIFQTLKAEELDPVKIAARQLTQDRFKEKISIANTTISQLQKESRPLQLCSIATK